MTEIPPGLTPPLIELLLSIADDKFILGQRTCDWTGLAPLIEEDIAFSSMAQDEIGHAGALYEFAARLRGDASADRLAYGRAPGEYRCAGLVTIPDEFDWALALARKFCCDHHDFLRLTRLANSALAPLAALGGRLLAEERVHLEHGNLWMTKLGRGGAEAAGRMQAALDRIAPHAATLFEPPAGVERLEQAGIYPPESSDIYDQWNAAVQPVMATAGLRLAVSRPQPALAGGRRGRQGPELEALLGEMCEVYRLDPDAAW